MAVAIHITLQCEIFANLNDLQKLLTFHACTSFRSPDVLFIHCFLVFAPCLFSFFISPSLPLCLSLSLSHTHTHTHILSPCLQLSLLSISLPLLSPPPSSLLFLSLPLLSPSLSLSLSLSLPFSLSPYFQLHTSTFRQPSAMFTFSYLTQPDPIQFPPPCMTVFHVDPPWLQIISNLHCQSYIWNSCDCS